MPQANSYTLTQRKGVTAPRFPSLACLVFIACLSVNQQLLAQEKNPYAGDTKIAKLGEYQFRLNCAFCHGLGARGGGRGPDLTRVQKRHGNSDAEIFHNIHDGIPGTAMPAATNGGIGVGMSDEEIWQVVTYLRSAEVKGPAQPAGNAAHGKELFNGAAGCSTCHMMEGKGGRLGPDLTSVGASRSTEYLVESLRNPSRRLAQGIFEAMKEFPQEYVSVSVVTADGTKLSGVVLNEDQFTLQMLDTQEQLHFFEKDRLRSLAKKRKSAMPVYDQKTLSDKDLQDLIAYLQTAGAQ
ncbi:MAG TPA: c-type cytochrome [Candidatus Acidoferrum sp.]|nr:c-type cytochrome [Candidatus Acidoferrum sp.]